MVFLRGLPWRRRYPPHAITNGAALKRELITRWRHDRKAYGEAKTAAARQQQQLWGSDPTGWSRFAEPLTRPLFEAVLAATSVTAGTHLLDAGCGSGLLLALAAARGATVTGLDVSPGLLTVARDHVPDAELWLGDLQELPFPNDIFGAVTGVNAFQFAGDPPAALCEAGRVKSLPGSPGSD